MGRKITFATTLILVVVLFGSLAMAASEVFLGVTTEGAGIGLEIGAGDDLNLMFMLKQKGGQAGIRYTFSNDLFAGAYVDTGKTTNLALGIGTKIYEAYPMIFTLEGGLRTSGSLYALVSVGYPF